MLSNYSTTEQIPLLAQREEPDRVAVLIARKDNSPAELERAADYREMWNNWAEGKDDVIVTILDVDLLPRLKISISFLLQTMITMR